MPWITASVLVVMKPASFIALSQRAGFPAICAWTVNCGPSISFRVGMFFPDVGLVNVLKRRGIQFS